MVSSNRLAIKSYPTNPDDWSEETLSAAEGAWQVNHPANAQLSLDAIATVGNASVRLYNPAGGNWVDFQFSLYDGREFDGTKSAATLNFFINLQAGRWDAVFDVYLYDAAGRFASRKNISVTVDGSFHHFALPLGSGVGWEETSGFDWRFLKAIMFRCLVAYPWPEGNIWIDEFHFSYYELELGKLTILSDPLGKQFRIDSSYYTTPQYGLGLLPYTDYTIGIDSTDFKQWENGDLNPVRTINLAEAQELTITAYYATAPPPGKGTLYVTANVTATVEVIETGTRKTTPCYFDLNPGTYTVRATYKEQTQEASVSISEGITTPINFNFKLPTNYIPVFLGLACIGILAIIIYPKLTTK